jgi:hypothetical protein
MIRILLSIGVVPFVLLIFIIVFTYRAINYLINY